MKRNNGLIGLLFAAMTVMLLMCGCASTGRTAAEVHQDRYNTFQHDLWQMQDDVDSVLMIDRPSRLSDKMVR